MGSTSSLVATQRGETTKVNHNRNCVLNRLRIDAAISRAKREITGPISVGAFSDRLARIIFGEGIYL